MKAHGPAARSTGTTAAGEETRTLGLVKAKIKGLYISEHVFNEFYDLYICFIQGAFAACIAGKTKCSPIAFIKRVCLALIALRSILPLKPALAKGFALYDRSHIV